MINFIHSFNKYCLLAKHLAGYWGYSGQEEQSLFSWSLQSSGGGNKGQPHRQTQNYDLTKVVVLLRLNRFEVRRSRFCLYSSAQ